MFYYKKLNEEQQIVMLIKSDHPPKKLEGLIELTEQEYLALIEAEQE